MAEPICLWAEKTTDHNYIVNPLQMDRHLILLTDHARLYQITQRVTPLFEFYPNYAIAYSLFPQSFISRLQLSPTDKHTHHPY